MNRYQAAIFAMQVAFSFAGINDTGQVVLCVASCIAMIAVATPKAKEGP